MSAKTSIDVIRFTHNVFNLNNRRWLETRQRSLGASADWDGPIIIIICDIGMFCHNGEKIFKIWRFFSIFTIFPQRPQYSQFFSFIFAIRLIQIFPSYPQNLNFARNTRTTINIRPQHEIFVKWSLVILQQLILAFTQEQFVMTFGCF